MSLFDDLSEGDELAPPADRGPDMLEPWWKKRALGAPVWLWGALLGVVALGVWRRKDVAAGVRAALDIVWKDAHPKNFTSRSGSKITAVVIHTTEASFGSATSWFAMDHAGYDQGPSSAHYVIAKDGRVAQMVREEDAAYHAGDAINLTSIGIELEGAAADASGFPQAQMAALVALCQKLAIKYGIPIRKGNPGFLGHVDIPSAAARGKVDPGPYFPWDSFIAAVGRMSA